MRDVWSRRTRHPTSQQQPDETQCEWCNRVSWVLRWKPHVVLVKRKRNKFRLKNTCKSNLCSVTVMSFKGLLEKDTRKPGSHYTDENCCCRVFTHGKMWYWGRYRGNLNLVYIPQPPLVFLLPHTRTPPQPWPSSYMSRGLFVQGIPVWRLPSTLKNFPPPAARAVPPSMHPQGRETGLLFALSGLFGFYSRYPAVVASAEPSVCCCTVCSSVWSAGKPG